LSTTASDCVTQKQLLIHVNIIIKHSPIYNRHDVFALHRQLQNSKITFEQIDFGCFSIVICNNTAALPCKSILACKLGYTSILQKVNKLEY